MLPLLFAFIYGSGFVSAKYSLTYSDPISFLCARFALSALVIGVIALIRGSRFPRGVDALNAVIAGLMTSGIFGICSFLAIYSGMSPAVSALVISLQPIVVSVLARFLLQEKLTLLNWGGLMVGFGGVTLVLWGRVHFDSLGVNAIALSLLSLLGVSAGNVYQKKVCSDMDIFAGGAVQSASAGILAGVVGMFWGDRHVAFVPELFISLIYMSVGVSVGALSLLFLMIRRGEVSKVVSVYYLVPVFAALAAYAIFGDVLDKLMIVGMALAGTGVWLTRLPRVSLIRKGS